jgi:hypothetical protein
VPQNTDYLKESEGKTLATLEASDISQGSIVGFMDWLRDRRGNAAPTVNHRLSEASQVFGQFFLRF